MGPTNLQGAALDIERRPAISGLPIINWGGGYIAAMMTELEHPGKATPNNKLKILEENIISKQLSKCQAVMTILHINFGYTQVLFMGSVPRINCLLVTSFVKAKAIKSNKGLSLLYG